MYNGKANEIVEGISSLTHDFLVFLFISLLIMHINTLLVALWITTIVGIGRHRQEENVHP